MSNMALHLDVNETMANTSFNSTSNDEESELSKTVIGLLLMAFLLVVALSNLLVVLSLRYHKKIVISDILLCSLSMSDFINGIFALQILIFTKYLVAKPWEKVVCDIFVVLVNSLRFASGSTVALIALERAFLLVFPTQYHIRVTISKAKKAVAVVWVASILLGLLPFLGVGHSGFDDGKCLYQFYFLGQSTAVILLIVSFLLLTSALVCFIAITLSSKRFIQRQKILAPGMNKDETDSAKKTSTANIRRVTVNSITSSEDTDDVTASRTSIPPNIKSGTASRTNQPDIEDAKPRIKLPMAT